MAAGVYCARENDGWAVYSRNESCISTSSGSDETYRNQGDLIGSLYELFMTAHLYLLASCVLQ